MKKLALYCLTVALFASCGREEEKIRKDDKIQEKEAPKSEKIVSEKENSKIELPIIDAFSPTWDDYILFEVLEHYKESLSWHYRVPAFNVSVEFRKDMRDYTSVLLINKKSNDAEAAIILVPKKEDVEIWGKWIDVIKKRVEEKLGRYRPQRILPKE
ncbi:MAG: hypothetical protein HYT03_02505 [Candidatus Harrisonbacteria bacterium]|nr:hypothetical protein [Candidatus Harrisonbacteria bacterium]